MEHLPLSTLLCGSLWVMDCKIRGEGKVHIVITLIWSHPQRIWNWVNTQLQD